MRRSSRWAWAGTIALMMLISSAGLGLHSGTAHWGAVPAFSGNAGAGTSSRHAPTAVPATAALVSAALKVETGSAEPYAEVASIPVGIEPGDLVYDAAKRVVLVTNSNSDNVSVISDQSNTVVRTVPLGSGPSGIAYDSADGKVFVTVTNLHNMSVLCGAGITCDYEVVATFSVGGLPLAVAYDAATAQVFVTNLQSNSVSVISDATYKVAATVPVGQDPQSAAYDAATGQVFVTNLQSDSVSVISDTTDTVVATVPVGGAPIGAVYDAGTGQVYVTDSGSSEVSVISDATDAVVATIPVGYEPYGVAYDAATGQVFVANYVSNNVSVISDLTDKVVTSVAVGIGPNGMAFDPGTNELFVTNAVSNNVSVISVPPGSYGAMFSETGLPTGTLWFANISGQTSLSSTTTMIPTALPNGSYTFTAATVDKEYSSPGGGFTVAGAGIWETLSFSLVRYAVTFTATGLPSGTEWFVNLSKIGQGHYSSTTNAITLAEPNGSYTYAVATTNKDYAASGASFTVSGESVSQSIAFALQTYPVRFTETGLLSETLAKHGWTVVLDGARTWSTDAAITFLVPNGTYPVLVTGPSGYTVSSNGGFVSAVTTKGGASVAISIGFGTTFTFSFGEKGLPKGQSWCVAILGAKECSTTSSLKYQNLTAGTYACGVVTPLSGQTILGKVGQAEEVLTGGVLVSGDVSSNTKMVLTFTYPYAVTFTQTGLTSGHWWVTMGKQTLSNSTADSLTFEVGNGTDGYKISPVSGFTSVGSPKKVVVNGAGITVTVTFTAKKGKSGVPVELLAMPLVLAVIPASLRKQQHRRLLPRAGRSRRPLCPTPSGRPHASLGRTRVP